MTKQQFKNETITNLFKNKDYKHSDPKKCGVAVKIEGMLFRSGMTRVTLNIYKDDIVSEAFLQLHKTYDDDKFYEKFYGKPNQLDATLILTAGNVGIRNGAKPVDGLKNPKACLRDEIGFASSYKSSFNNVIEPTEKNTEYEGMNGDGVSNEVLADTLPDMFDKNELYEFVKSKLTESENDVLESLASHKKRPGRKGVDLQSQIDAVKLKMKDLLNDEFPNYYVQKAWSIGEQMSKYKNANYKYIDDEETT